MPPVSTKHGLIAVAETDFEEQMSELSEENQRLAARLQVRAAGPALCGAVTHPQVVNCYTVIQLTHRCVWKWLTEVHACQCIICAFGLMLA